MGLRSTTAFPPTVSFRMIGSGVVLPSFHVRDLSIPSLGHPTRTRVDDLDGTGHPARSCELRGDVTSLRLEEDGLSGVLTTGSRAAASPSGSTHRFSTSKRTQLKGSTVPLMPAVRSRRRIARPIPCGRHDCSLDETLVCETPTNSGRERGRRFSRRAESAVPTLLDQQAVCLGTQLPVAELDDGRLGETPSRLRQGGSKTPSSVATREPSSPDIALSRGQPATQGGELILAVGVKGCDRMTIYPASPALTRTLVAQAAARLGGTRWSPTSGPRARPPCVSQPLSLRRRAGRAARPLSASAVRTGPVLHDTADSLWSLVSVGPFAGHRRPLGRSGRPPTWWRQVSRNRRASHLQMNCQPGTRHRRPDKEDGDVDCEAAGRAMRRA